MQHQRGGDLSLSISRLLPTQQQQHVDFQPQPHLKAMQQRTNTTALTRVTAAQEESSNSKPIETSLHYKIS